MRHFWIFVHLLGFTMWMGGGLAAMFIGLGAKREARESLGVVMRQLAIIYRVLVLPGTMATVVSGLVLTLTIYGNPGASLAVSHSLMTMQGFGLIAAVITLVMMVPNVSKLVRIDPVTQAAQFDAIRQKQSRLGMLSGILAMLALIAGALGRP